MLFFYKLKIHRFLFGDWTIRFRFMEDFRESVFTATVRKISAFFRIMIFKTVRASLMKITYDLSRFFQKQFNAFADRRLVLANAFQFFEKDRNLEFTDLFPKFENFQKSGLFLKEVRYSKRRRMLVCSTPNPSNRRPWIQFSWVSLSFIWAWLRFDSTLNLFITVNSSIVLNDS